MISCAHAWPLLDRYTVAFEEAGVEWDLPVVNGQQLEEDELIPIIGRYHGVLAGDDILSARVLDHAHHLRIISKWGVGVDAIDVSYAASKGIVVTNTPGVFAHELADYAMGYLIMLARQQHVANAMVREGRWPRIRGESLEGKTIGLIGLGSSGQEFARRLAVMGLSILAVEPNPLDAEFLVQTGVRLVTLPELLERSDIVSLHAPSTPATAHLIDEAALAKLKDGAWLINIARGALVDETALVAALDSGKVSQAALDVFEQEPLAPGHPLRGRDNVILGSHNGSNTRQAAERTTERAVRNLLDGLRGSS